MIQWKVSALSFALGALATVGFVWLGGARRFSRARSGSDEAARDDALHDLATLPEDAFDADIEPVMEESPFGDAVVADDRYDAVDPEDLGSEWLRRATESVPESPESQGVYSETETAADVAAELPVGTIDSEGNTELHPEKIPNPTPADLSPNEQELAQRAENAPPGEGSNQGHG